MYKIETVSPDKCLITATWGVLILLTPAVKWLRGALTLKHRRRRNKKKKSSSTEWERVGRRWRSIGNISSRHVHKKRTALVNMCTHRIITESLYTQKPENMNRQLFFFLKSARKRVQLEMKEVTWRSLNKMAAYKADDVKFICG